MSRGILPSPGDPTNLPDLENINTHKINSINMKPELQFAHRLMMISVCGPRMISRNTKLIHIIYVRAVSGFMKSVYL